MHAHPAGGCYAPTAEHPEEQLDYLEELDTALAAIPERNMLLTAGDFNARVGSRGSDSPELYAGCQGPHEVGERNVAGKKLLSCTQARAAQHQRYLLPGAHVAQQ